MNRDITDFDMDKIHDKVLRNFHSIQNRILEVGGDPDKIDIVAVTKGRTLAEIKSLLSLPIAALAGNYAEEMLKTVNTLESLCADLNLPTYQTDLFLRKWHFIGQIQRRSVSKLYPHISLWQSVDRIEEMEKIARYAPESAILVEINGYDLAKRVYKNYDSSLSLSKDFGHKVSLSVNNTERGGISVDEIEYFIEYSITLGLDVKGFMTIAPLGGADVTRSAFDSLAEVTSRFGMGICSMGMSSDFDLAVKSGSNMLRIGKALFA